MFTVKYNRTTNHIDGLTVRTTGGGNDMGDHISDYAQNACPSLTRYRFAQGPEFDDLEDALEAARFGTRKLCKHCEKAAEAMLEAARVAREERLNRDPRGDEWMGRTIGDAVTVTVQGRTFETELTGADHITPGWTVAYVDEDGQRTDTFVVVTEDDIVKNEGGSTMAAKKLKLKDVRGDVLIGFVSGSDVPHAIKGADDKGRNVPFCSARPKNPLRSFGPAMEQKPELELCAGCSKVVPTGDVTVTEEPVNIPGLNLTVNQKVITPVEGTDGEKEAMPAKKTDAQPAQDVDAQITRVHEFVDAIKTAETQDAVNALAGQAEDVIVSVPTKHRTTLRTAVSDAKKARLTELTPEGDAPADPKKAGAEVAPRVAADVAEDFNKFEGVPELIADGVKLFGEGIDLGLKLGNVGEKLAHTMLAMRQKITNPDTGLPDLTAERKTTKNAAAEVYAQAKKKIADDDVERQGAHNSIVRATQNKMSDVLVDWVRSFDGPDRTESLAVLKDLFGDAVADVPEETKLSEVVYDLYEEKGIELPRYGRTELARYDRRVKAIEAATKELDALKDSDKDANPKEVEALEEKVKELKADVPADVLAEKLEPKAEKSDAEKTAEALAAVKAQLEKAGKRFSKVKAANEKRKAKAELYGIIRAAADAFDLDLSALVTADEE